MRKPSVRLCGLFNKPMSGQPCRCAVLACILLNTQACVLAEWVSLFRLTGVLFYVMLCFKCEEVDGRFLKDLWKAR